MSKPTLEVLPKAATGVVRFGEAKTGFPESTVVKDQPVEPPIDEGMTFREMMEGLKQAQQTSFQGHKPEAKAKVKAAEPVIEVGEISISKPEETQATAKPLEASDVSPDDAAQTKFQDAYTKSNEDSGVKTSGKIGDYEYVKTGDGKEYLVGHDPYEVFDVTDMTTNEINDSYRALPSIGDGTRWRPAIQVQYPRLDTTPPYGD